MKSVYIIFSTPVDKKLIGAALIRLIENRPYSHVSLKWLDADNWKILEAYGGGVRVQPARNFYSRNVDVKVYKIVAPTVLVDTAISKSEENIGASYGYLSVLGQAIHKLLAVFGIKSGIPFRDSTKTMFCSEAIALFLKNLDSGISDKLEDYETLTPSDVDKILAAATKSQNNNVQVTLVY
jgi:hypothetical protein